jgi:hypothetical protein
MCRWRVLGALAGLTWLLLLSSGQAVGSPLALHLSFRHVAGGVASLSASGDYVGYSRSGATAHGGSTAFVLRDERTGAQSTLRRPDCGPGTVGVPWVAFECSHGPLFQLYNVRTHKWRRIRCDRQCQPYQYMIESLRVGVNWLAVEIAPHEGCGDGVHNDCGANTHLFYNIATGKPRVPNLTQKTMVDLDSTKLTRRVCSPLTVPSYSAASPGFPPLLTFYGKFGLAQESNGVYLRRCGSHLNMPLVSGYYAGQLIGNAHAVALCRDSRQPGAGIFLPSLRRFTFTLPSTAERCWAAALSPDHLYVLDTQRSVLWDAAFPADPGRTRTPSR